MLGNTSQSAIEGQGKSSGAASDPSLVNNVQSGAWTKKQKRLYQRLLSWLTLKNHQGKQLIRVDLTTADLTQRPFLRVHFKELKRRILRVYGYDLDNFIIETSEGRGVLHMVWAIDAEQAAWIDQGFISAEWLKIHGAHRVWIKRVRGNKADRRRVARYMVTQYLVQQGERGSALVRYSYSWWKCSLVLGRGWQAFKGFYAEAQSPLQRELNRSDMRARGPDGLSLLDHWNDLLAQGSCRIGRQQVFVYNRAVVTSREFEKGIFG